MDGYSKTMPRRRTAACNERRCARAAGARIARWPGAVARLRGAVVRHPATRGASRESEKRKTGLYPPTGASPAAAALRDGFVRCSRGPRAMRFYVDRAPSGRDTSRYNRTTCARFALLYDGRAARVARRLSAGSSARRNPPYPPGARRRPRCAGTPSPENPS